jgi:hypothetical protein
MKRDTMAIDVQALRSLSMAATSCIEVLEVRRNDLDQAHCIGKRTHGSTKNGYDNMREKYISLSINVLYLISSGREFSICVIY